ncbi:MAG: hypothetical protein HS126_40160 [Anaerolineales bacterium]|nr:hypothetical protein [Anaerolineales bacterium]
MVHRSRRGAAIVFLVLALLALGQRNEAERQRVEAEAAQATSEARRAEADKQRQLAVARQLAAQSQLALDNTGAGLVRSALLAIESRCGALSPLRATKPYVED